MPTTGPTRSREHASSDFWVTSRPSRCPHRPGCSGKKHSLPILTRSRACAQPVHQLPERYAVAFKDGLGAIEIDRLGKVLEDLVDLRLSYPSMAENVRHMSPGYGSPDLGHLLISALPGAEPSRATRMSCRMLPAFQNVVRTARLGKPNRDEAAGEASSHD